MNSIRLFIVALLAAFAFAGCGAGGSGGSGDASSDTDADTDADTDSDTDADTDADLPLTHSPMTACDGGRYDPDSDLCWQDPLVAFAAWDDVAAYCDGSEVGGHMDWRLPTISELRSLFRRGSDAECDAMEWDVEWTDAPEGYCGVQDGCLETSCWNENGCKPSACGTEEGPGSEGCYWDSVLSGACSAYWTSSPLGTDTSVRWYVNFSIGSINGSELWAIYYGRCVRSGS